MKKVLLLLMVLAAPVILTGCETVKGAVTGAVQDVRNLPNPDKNGWNASKKVDAWMQENLW